LLLRSALRLLRRASWLLRRGFWLLRRGWRRSGRGGLGYCGLRSRRRGRWWCLRRLRPRRWRQRPWPRWFGPWRPRPGGRLVIRGLLRSRLLLRPGPGHIPGPHGRVKRDLHPGHRHPPPLPLSRPAL